MLLYPRIAQDFLTLLFKIKIWQYLGLSAKNEKKSRSLYFLELLKVMKNI